MTLRLDTMVGSDIPRCAYLEQLIFGKDDPWPEMAFHSELASPDTRYLTARDDHVVGYAGIVLLGTDDFPEAEIRTLGVDPRRRRRGIGARLLDALLAIADDRGGAVFLEVRTDNLAAVSLYASRGFQVIGLRPNYYRRSHADAHTMCRPAPARPAGLPVDCEDSATVDGGVS